uniref:Uncharacterized protein n=1 Tax=Termitomyces sp. TaxID=1916073 RepID=A0A386TYR9_9AGAR|nr:hypothetical protein C0992_000013 [Termitomyces sp.]AYE93329.1 hypothetical protein C0992_000014 [Termitomyces sp.]
MHYTLSLKNLYLIILNFIILNMKNILKRAWKGIVIGWNTPILPDHLLELQSRPIIRIFRVLGGISTLSLLGKGYIKLDIYGLYIAIILTSMFVIYNIYFSYQKIKHIRKIIKRGDLDVRNSPLDRFASLFVKLVVCGKGFCDYVPQIGGALGLLLGMDQILRESNREAFFGPLIGQGINKVFPNKSEVEIWKDNLQKHMATADSETRDSKVLNKLIADTKEFSHFSDNDRKDILSALDEIQRANNSDLAATQQKVRDILNNPPKK